MGDPPEAEVAFQTDGPRAPQDPPPYLEGGGVVPIEGQERNSAVGRLGARRRRWGALLQRREAGGGGLIYSPPSPPLPSAPIVAEKSLLWQTPLQSRWVVTKGEHSLPAPAKAAITDHPTPPPCPRSISEDRWHPIHGQGGGMGGGQMIDCIDRVAIL